MNEKTILILGGGIGGIVTARELRSHLGKDHRVVVVEKAAVHSFPPSYLWVMLGWRKPEAILKPLSLLSKYGIEIQHTVVREIDLERRAVKTDASTIAFDYLVVALGAELAPYGVAGMQESIHSFYTLDGAQRLRSALQTFGGGRIAIVVTNLPYKCPPVPYEAAFLLESFFSRKERFRPGAGTKECKVEIYTPEPFPLAAAGIQAGTELLPLLEQRGILYRPDHKVKHIDPAKKQLTFENGVLAEFDLCLAVPPHRAPEVVRSSGLNDAAGWIPVNPRNMQTQHPDVYAIGDVATVPLANGSALPKVGVFALNQAETVAHNIACDILHHGMKKDYPGTGFCFLETGNGKAGYIHGDFYNLPAPKIEVHEPSVTYHWAKVVAEKYWLWRWF